MTETTNPFPTIQPMGWGRSLLYFGLPAAALLAAFYGLMPWLIAGPALFLCLCV
jgi:hypothetical protein